MLDCARTLVGEDAHILTVQCAVVAVNQSQPDDPQDSCIGNVAKITSQILTGSTAQAEALFFQYDRDRHVVPVVFVWNLAETM